MDWLPAFLYPIFLPIGEISHLLIKMNEVISVPKDKKAERMLDHDKVLPSQLIELEVSDEDFSYLYNSGYWDLVNKIANSNIDDFEDESITDAHVLAELIKALETRSFSYDRRLEKWNDNVCALFREAYSRKTSIHFFF